MGLDGQPVGAAQQPQLGRRAGPARPTTNCLSPPPSGVASGRLGGEEEGAPPPPALELDALCFSRPLLIEPSLTLTGTTTRAAPRRNGISKSRLLPATAAVAAAAAGGRGSRRRGRSSTVRRRRMCTCGRTLCMRWCALWPPLLPPRAASLTRVTPSTYVYPLRHCRCRRCRCRAVATPESASAQSASEVALGRPTAAGRA